MPDTAYLSLGSNLGSREAQLRTAIKHLKSLGLVVVSSFYETEPVEVTDQPWFLNCAIALQTTKGPSELMSELLNLERTMGRLRTHPKGPRTIDIDLLLFDDLIIDTPELTVPHPAMQERRFVLEPLAEIAPDARHPMLKKTVRELLRDLPEGQIVRKVKAG